MGKMSKSTKTRSFLWLTLKSLVAGSVVFSRTFATPAPVAPDHVEMVDAWRSVGQQMGANPTTLPPLDGSLIDMIAAADLTENLADVVLATYDMIEASMVRSLDAHWASVLTSAGNAGMVAEFLNIRSGMDTGAKPKTEVDSVLWLESRMSKQGCDSCNSGGGNGSETDPNNDCDPGNSGGHNNGKD